MNRRKKYVAILLILCLTMGFGFQVLGAQSKWVLKDGNWMYLNEDGTYKCSTWFQDKNQWYHFDEKGYMQTGWLSTAGKWYYLNNSGVMQTGWLQNRDSWYYFDKNGAMKTGWFLDQDKWYYLNSLGAMKIGWLQDGDTWYYLSASGAMKTGWVQVNNVWYYLKSTGAMVTGWLQEGTKRYYLVPSGAMLANVTQVIDGVSYFFDASGASVLSTDNNNASQASTTFKTGTWADSKVFTNSWSNIKMTISSGCEIFTPQQMRSEAGTGQKILINDGAITEDTANAYPDTVTYDFMIRLNDQNSTIKLSYLNINSGAASVSVEQYAVSLSEQLSANLTLPHVIEGTERVILAGNAFVKLKTTMLSRTINQDIYMRKLDHYIVMLTVTYKLDNVSYVNTALSGIAAVQ